MLLDGYLGRFFSSCYIMDRDFKGWPGERVLGREVGEGGEPKVEQTFGETEIAELCLQ